MRKDRIKEDDREQTEDADGAEAREHLSRVVVAAFCSHLPLLADFWVDSLVIDPAQACCLEGNGCDKELQEVAHAQQKLHSLTLSLRIKVVGES